jgi:hypothetical protein
MVLWIYFVLWNIFKYQMLPPFAQGQEGQMMLLGVLQQDEVVG